MPRSSIHPLWGTLSFDRRADISLQEQIACFFRSAIRDGRLKPGMRVRASREFARDYGISRTTAIEAYQRLVDEGYLVTRPRSGVFVPHVLPESFAPRAARVTPRGAARTMPRDLIGIDGRTYELPLAPGMPALDHFPWVAWTRILHQLCRERPLNAVGYGDPQGEPPLREAIAQYLSSSRGIICEPWQIIVISGSEQTVAFATSQVTTPGDSAWFENPSYPLLRHALEGVGLNAVPVPVDEHGLRVTDGLREAANARLAIVSPTHQYPLGFSMSRQRRDELIDWSRRSGSWLLEHEIDGDYRYSAQPIEPLYALAKAERVIYCGSLSKPLAPGLRTNYLVVPAGAVASFDIRPTHVPMLMQLALERLSSEGYLVSHMHKMRRLYAKRRALLLDALRSEAAGLLNVDPVPDAGLRVTAGLLVELNDVQLASDCLATGIKVNPLSVCYALDCRRSGLIIGFASTPEDKILPAVRTLAGVIRRTLAGATSATAPAAAAPGAARITEYELEP